MLASPAGHRPPCWAPARSPPKPAPATRSASSKANMPGSTPAASSATPSSSTTSTVTRSGWSMDRIRAGHGRLQPHREHPGARQPGWTAREVICSSTDSRYPSAACLSAAARSSPSRSAARPASRAAAGVTSAGRLGQPTAAAPASASSATASRERRCASYGPLSECATGFRGQVYLRSSCQQPSCVEGRSWGQKPARVGARNCRALPLGRTRDCATTSAAGRATASDLRRHRHQLAAAAGTTAMVVRLISRSPTRLRRGPTGATPSAAASG